MSNPTRLPRGSLPKQDAGFTYIELLVAVALLLACLLTLAGMFVAGTSSVHSSGKLTMGVSAARQMLEDGVDVVLLTPV